MKVIDLLNKIAKGEEVPKYINYNHRVFGENTMLVCKENIINKLDTGAIELNDEVEIIEEDKKIPEKVDRTKCVDFAYTLEKTLNTLDSLIDYLKSKGE